MFSLEAPPARDFPSPDSERDWLTTVLTSPSAMFDWLSGGSLDGSSGKMFPEPSAQTKDRTLAVFSPDSPEWTFPFRKAAGRTAASWSVLPVTTVSPGACLTRSMPEYHSAAVASSLSDILETGDVPQRYYLSAKACAGILRRAAKRGKTLPTMLLRALQQVAEASSGPEIVEAKTASSPSVETTLVALST
jgi:hypothetical protein